MANKPLVLFVCVHNAGRSQMAAAFMNSLSEGAVEVRSAGSEPTDRLNPAVVEAMGEIGIDIAAAQPKLLSNDAVAAADVVITMGCGDACPYYPGSVTKTGRSRTPPARSWTLCGRYVMRSSVAWRLC
jgi:arsenate reductase